jgi:hypothetical protein
LGLSSEQPMHFCDGKAELFPLLKFRIRYTVFSYRSRGPVRFPTLPDFLRSSGCGTGFTEPRDYN